MTAQQASRDKEHVSKLSKLSRAWLKSFLAFLRASLTHESNNQIFMDPISKLLSLTGEIFQMEGRLEWKLMEDHFFLNGLWIRPVIADRTNLFALADLFKNNQLEGFHASGIALDKDWRTLAQVFSELKSAVGGKADFFNEKLSALGQGNFKFVAKTTDQKPIDMELPIPVIPFSACVTYAKAMLCVREFHQAQQGEEKVSSNLKIQRITCDLIEQCERYESLFLLLLSFQGFDHYLPHHSVNTMILSVLLGKKMGMSRGDLSDLASAALVHDVGQLDASDVNQRVAFSEHPWHSARHLLSIGYVSESLARKSIVAYQHHAANLCQQTPSKVPVSIFSQIVAICARYVALTIARPHRAYLEPWEALQKMYQEHAQGAYEKTIFRKFLDLMKPLPPGSIVESDGQVGMVVRSKDVDPAQIKYEIYLLETKQWGHTYQKISPKRISLLKKRQAIYELLKNSENSPLLR